MLPDSQSCKLFTVDASVEVLNVNSRSHVALLAASCCDLTNQVKVPLKMYFGCPFLLVGLKTMEAQPLPTRRIRYQLIHCCHELSCFCAIDEAAATFLHDFRQSPYPSTDDRCLLGESFDSY